MKDVAYCIKCRQMTKTTEVRNDVSKNDRRIVRGKCVKCRSKTSRFIRGKVQKMEILSKMTKDAMIKDAIPNPTLKERMERAVVKPILKTKVNFVV